MNLRCCERGFLILIGCLTASFLGVLCAPAQSPRSEVASGRSSEAGAKASSRTPGTSATASQWTGGANSFGKQSTSSWGTKGASFDAVKSEKWGEASASFGYKAQPGGIWRVEEAEPAGAEKAGAAAPPANLLGDAGESTTGVPGSSTTPGFPQPTTRRTSLGGTAGGGLTSRGHLGHVSDRRSSRSSGLSTHRRHARAIGSHRHTKSRGARKGFNPVPSSSGHGLASDLRPPQPRTSLQTPKLGGGLPSSGVSGHGHGSSLDTGLTSDHRSGVNQ